METFNIIAGVSSIVSLVISGVALFKVNALKKTNIKSTSSVQSAHGSNIKQVGRDYNGK